MALINSMKMQILARNGNESFIRSAIAAFCSELDPSVDVINDIKTAVSEAVTNVIIHAYCEIGKEYIYIDVDLHDDFVEIVIKDLGCGILDIEVAMQPMFTTRMSDGRCGMGFTFMQTFMDDVNVISKENEGTIVRMKKYIQT